MTSPSQASIVGLTHRSSQICVHASASYDDGIGRVDFVLIDLAGNALTNVVERKDVEFGTSLPKQVDEFWGSSAALSPDAQYRVFFHVYDRSGVNLVAYDRRDFTCASAREESKR